VTRFDADTAVVADPDRPGLWRARCDEGWFTPRGPNGGYVAAMVLRAMQAELDRGEGAGRPPRSLTLHYLRPPAAGELDVVVTVERSGRSLSTLTARAEQDGRLCVIAVGAFGVDFASADAYAEAPPVVAPPEGLQPLSRRIEGLTMAERFTTRVAVGAPVFSGGDEALTGGWISFADGPQTLDAPALAMLTDAWIPAPFTRLRAFVGAPTIDLTIHFRAPEVLAAEPVLCVFRSRAAHGGYFEEDGELWSADGVLLAQSRQLALLLPS
jgi:acyl-CoA thioesterase